MKKMLHYLLVTGTISDIGTLLPALVSQQKNFFYCISNDTVNFCSNCKNGSYSKSKVDKGLPLNTSLKVSSGADDTSSLSYSSIKSVSTIIPMRNNNKDESSYVLSIGNHKKTTGLTYSSIKSVFTNRPKQDNHMDESLEPDVPNPATSLPVSSISSVSKPIQDKQTNESTNRSVSADECMEQTTNSFGSSEMSLPKVIPSQDEFTDKRLKTSASIEELNAMTQTPIQKSNSKAPEASVSNSSIQNESSARSFRAERLPMMRNILLYYDCKTKIEYQFIYSHSRGSLGQYYKCNRKSVDDLICGKGLYVRDGYFTKNPAKIGHICIPAKKNSSRVSCCRGEPMRHIPPAKTDSHQLKSTNVLDTAPKAKDSGPIRFLAERVAGISRYILLYRHLKTGREYRFSYSKMLRSGIQAYQCNGSNNGIPCRKHIHVENGYFLANPAVGHICKAIKGKTAKWS